MTIGRRSASRLPAVALIAVVAGLALAAGASMSASASPSSSGPAAAAAGALNLRSTDLPKSMGWKMLPAPSPASLHSTDAQLSQCYGGQYGHVLADVQSAFWTRGKVQVSSDAEIFATPAEAAADLKALGSSLGLACQQTAVRTSSATKSQPLDTIRAASDAIPVRTDGTGGVVGFRTTVELLKPAPHPSTLEGTYVFDTYVFLRAQAEISISFGNGEISGATAIPPPLALEQSLTGLLVARSKSLG
jgi:hypothetical protein